MTRVPSVAHYLLAAVSRFRFHPALRRGSELGLSSPLPAKKGGRLFCPGLRNISEIRPKVNLFALIFWTYIGLTFSGFYGHLWPQIHNLSF